MTREALMDEIMEKVPKKGVISDCKKVKKKFSEKSSVDLGWGAELAVWLFVYGEYEFMLRVCKLYDHLVFDGNYTLWENVKSTRALKAHICRLNGEEVIAKEIVNDLIKYEDIELCQSDTLDYYDDNIMYAIRDNYKPGIRNWKLIKLEMVIKMRELGLYSYSNEYLENEISLLKKDLAEYK